jgi:upstream activation factor subunit UAF30
VTPQETNEYTNIIDSILATADLETISRKKIREGLEAELGGKDLSAQKVRLSTARGQSFLQRPPD